MTMDEFIDRIAHLRVDRQRGIVKPYKPVMLAAVVILLHKGKIASRDVPLDGGLRSAFLQLHRMLYPDWPGEPKPEYPFRHLENDGVWKLVPHDGSLGDLHASKRDRAAAWNVLRHVRCAQLPDGVFDRLVASFEDRFRVLRVLSRLYFPSETSGRLWDVIGDPTPLAAPATGDRAAERLTERALEEHLERNWSETPFAERGVRLSTLESGGLPGRQVMTPVNTIDLLGLDGPRNEWWVFELKRGRTGDAVVGQVSRYIGWMQEEHCAGGRRVRGAIIAREADRKLRLAARPHPSLSLWTYDDELRVKAVG